MAYVTCCYLYRIAEYERGRRAFSPGARQRPLRTDGFRERKPIASPMKRPRIETQPYQEPGRPLGKPAYKIAAEPKVTNAVVIEKKPVLFNPTSKSVSDFPPLPQRKPVQKLPSKLVPQNLEPINTVPQREEPVKTGPQTKEPVRAVPQKQAPVKNVAQNQDAVATVPQQDPAKSAQKPTIVQKQEANPVAQKQPDEQLVPKSEPKTIAENKDVQAPEAKASEQQPTPSVEQAPGVRHQLDPLMSSVLHDELQQLMAKVSQELQKEPTTDAERLVVGKFRTVAGDDLKNALGLSVTKRILNIHNPLYVKLLFSGKPEAGCLQAFIGTYNISAFKRIGSPHDTFAARLDAVADFDRLCGAKEVTCGSAKVTVTPCYKFLTCPAAIESIYSAKTEDAKEKPDSSTSCTPQKQQNADKTEKSGAKTADVDKDSTQDNNQKEVSETKDVGDRTVENETVPAVKNTKTVAANNVKVNITIEAKSKTDNLKKNTSEEVTELETKTESPKGTAIKVTNQKYVVDKTNKVKNTSTEETPAVDGGTADDEEMTDHDILALMSSGIVLDECSGSDDEK